MLKAPASTAPVTLNSAIPGLRPAKNRKIRKPDRASAPLRFAEWTMLVLLVLLSAASLTGYGSEYAGAGVMLLGSVFVIAVLLAMMRGAIIRGLLLLMGGPAIALILLDWLERLN